MMSGIGDMHAWQAKFAKWHTRHRKNAKQKECISENSFFPNDRPKEPRKGPKWSPGGPKWSPRGSQMEPQRAQMEPKGLRWEPARGQMPPQAP